MRLDFQLSSEWNQRAASCDLAKADDSALRYDVFLGDLVFELGDCDFSARWGWIPLLDLAYSLKDMCDRLLTGDPEATFEFTESDAWIKMSRKGDDVEVLASHVSCTGRSRLSALCELVTASGREFFAKVAASHSELASNPAFARLRADVYRGPLLSQTRSNHPN